MLPTVFITISWMTKFFDLCAMLTLLISSAAISSLSLTPPGTCSSHQASTHRLVSPPQTWSTILCLFITPLAESWALARPWSLAAPWCLGRSSLPPTTGAMLPSTSARWRIFGFRLSTLAPPMQRQSPFEDTRLPQKTIVWVLNSDELPA